MDSLVVSLLRSDENDSSGTDPELQRDAAVRAHHGEDAVFFFLKAPELHQQTELICKTKHTSTVKPTA